MTDQKPNGVFVRLPLSNEQLGKLLAPIGTLNERMLAIGTPVTGGDIPVITTLPAGALPEPVPCIRQSDAQAKIAALEAEVVWLQEELGKSRKKNFNAGYLIACCNVFNMHNEEGIAADILAEAGITEEEVKALGLSEYDADALVEIRKARSEDPILKGGTA